MGADEGAPCAAHAAGPGEGTSREAAEDVDENVRGEADAVAAAVAGVHRDVATSRRAERPSFTQEEAKDAVRGASVDLEFAFSTYGNNLTATASNP
jgi:hypothetical protein